MRSWLVYRTTKVEPPPHFVLYSTFTLTFVAAILEQVSPVVRPTLATCMLTAPTIGVLDGMPAVIIAPLLLTAPGRTLAVAASTFVEPPSLANWERSATTWYGFVPQFVSTSPGCEMSSPIAA